MLECQAILATTHTGLVNELIGYKNKSFVFSFEQKKVCFSFHLSNYFYDNTKYYYSLYINDFSAMPRY